MKTAIDAEPDPTYARSPLRDAPSEQLEKILEAHGMWVASRGAQGESADLSGANLQGWDLSGRRLRGARLNGANLQGASLYGTDFRDADLQDADLSGATGLLTEQLAGANLRRARLPKDVLTGDELASIDGASRTTQTLLFSMLLACVYTWLTIWTTSDAGLLTNRVTSTLPFIGGTIPIVGFFWVVPFVLLGLYLYFHIHLLNLWEGLSRVPAVFPDGRPIDRVVYLWLLSSLVHTYWMRLRGIGGDPRALLLLQKWFTVLLAWGVVPGTLFLFWGRYLPRHDWAGTVLHILLVAGAIAAGIGFRRLTTVTLSGRREEATYWGKTVVAAVVSGTLLSLLSLGAIGGIPLDQYTMQHDPHWCAPGSPPLTFWDTIVWNCLGDEDGTPVPPTAEPISVAWIGVPWMLNSVRFAPFANFEGGVAVAPKPPSWIGEKKEEIALVEVVDLRGRNLRYAKAFQAFLANADMRRADLTAANLREAELQGARLEGASLVGANLRWAKLRWATLLDAKLTETALVEADLRGADLRRADLQWADLTSAQLQAANLQEAQLQWANLSYADLQGYIEPRQDLDILATKHTDVAAEHSDQWTDLAGARLAWADLTGAQLQAVNLAKAKLSWANLTTANLRAANLAEAELLGADLSNANLRGANLFGADLRWATLRAAFLWGVNFFGADLRGVDFTKAIGLTIEQIEGAVIDETTTLPHYFYPRSGGGSPTQD
jgi:uncharacterized protein YjbI with pentapeptide repeats